MSPDDSRPEPENGHTPAADADVEARRAEERFIADLISRGEAVPEGEELPPGATHEIVRDDQGRRTARRVRFKAF
jgi:hypothetical protein